MERLELEHFRSLLLEQLRRHMRQLASDQAALLDLNGAEAGDSVDISLTEINQEMVLRLGERESQIVADIDQALLRIDEGSYGECARCGGLINRQRLEAIPTARYDAACQSLVELNHNGGRTRTTFIA
jgi:DnaK suppressor protein